MEPTPPSAPREGRARPGPIAQPASLPAGSPVEVCRALSRSGSASKTAGSELVNVFSEVQRLGSGQKECTSVDTAVGNVTNEELEEIRHMKNPPPVVRRTIEVVYLILDAGTHPVPRSPPEWSKVRRIMERDFMSRILSFDMEVLLAAPRLSSYLVLEYFRAGGEGKDSLKKERLTYERVFRASPPTAALFNWCCKQLDIMEEEEEKVDAEKIELDARVLAPSITAYSTCPALYTLGVAVTENLPINDGGPVTMYSISPDLPLGMKLSSTTGVISGRPCVLVDDTFLIAATGEGGRDTFTLNIKITEPAPTIVSYSASPAIYTVLEVIEENDPVCSGPLSGFAVSPSLPSGLKIDVLSGKISGTPTVLTSKTDYRIEASGPGGASASYTLSMAVTQPIWQVLLGDRWEDDPILAEYAEECRVAGKVPTILKYRARGLNYTVDFKQMKQFGQRTTRPIRKICVGSIRTPDAEEC